MATHSSILAWDNIYGYVDMDIYIYEIIYIYIWKWIIYIYICVYMELYTHYIFFTHSSVSGHFNHFHILMSYE